MRFHYDARGRLRGYSTGLVWPVLCAAIWGALLLLPFSVLHGWLEWVLGPAWLLAGIAFAWGWHQAGRQQ